MSILDPLCCGFVKVGVYELVKSDIPVKEKFEKFLEGFPKIKVNFSTFRKRYNQIKENIESLGKTNVDGKFDVLFTFSSFHWSNLPDKEKLHHGTVTDCMGCLHNEKYRVQLANFPIRKKNFVFLKKAEQVGLFKTKNQRIMEEAKKDLGALNVKYKGQFAVSFQTALKKLNSSQEKARKAEIIRRAKTSIEDQWKDTTVLRYLVCIIV